MTHMYAISGISDAASIDQVKKALEGVQGVTAVLVQVELPQAKVTMSSHIQTSVLAAAVKQAGNYDLSDWLPHRH
ncbi:heavy-metal-associated domain-containing protein [Flavihumibacter rivuli]|uniref:heavy-metal-associated domain-containing protein n=1 Tax=Flavihumibacter rivuli TaxID=2838156 RepID=UPI001BDEF9E8|nr:heavy metal-associated domain-containing protein [Flavihumibacter rivuli]ULQ55180.1 heavy-metal-associated domain-containing protein [Flavihumibacter rivuli]